MCKVRDVLEKYRPMIGKKSWKEWKEMLLLGQGAEGWKAVCDVMMQPDTCGGKGSIKRNAAGGFDIQNIDMDADAWRVVVGALKQATIDTPIELSPAAAALTDAQKRLGLRKPYNQLPYDSDID